MAERTPITVADRTLSVSNLDKVLYPETGFTKGQVIEYYTKIAPIILPHLRNRPLSLKRYPEGVRSQFFFQKNCPDHRPDWIETMRVRTEGKRSESTEIEFCVINDEPGLIWLANLAALELHTYLSTTADFGTPTMMVFDLDPGPGADLGDCLRVGLELRDALEHFNLRSFAKTSGGKGLHLAVPLNTTCTFDRTKAFSRAIAGVIARNDPEKVTTIMSKRERQGRVFIDWSQNDRHKTTVCAYSLRAQPRQTVSLPTSWERIERAHRRSEPKSLIALADDAVRRVRRSGDPFAEVLSLKQHLPGTDDVGEAIGS